MNYEFNLLNHVGVVAKRVCAAAAEKTAVHEGDDNTPSSRGVKNKQLMTVGHFKFDIDEQTFSRFILYYRYSYYERFPR